MFIGVSDLDDRQCILITFPSDDSVLAELKRNIVKLKVLEVSWRQGIKKIWIRKATLGIYHQPGWRCRAFRWG